MGADGDYILAWFLNGSVMWPLNPASLLFSPRDMQGPMVSCGDCGRFDVKKHQAQGQGQGGCLVNMSCSGAQSPFGGRATNRTDAHWATWSCSKINLEERRQGAIVFPHGEGCSQSRTGCVLHCLAQGSVLNPLICFDLRELASYS